MKAIDNIIKLIKKGKTIAEIATELDVSRQAVDSSIRAYAKKNEELAYCGDYLFKKVGNSADELLRLRITSIICKDKYVQGRYIINSRFKPDATKQPPKEIKAILAENIPIEIQELLKKLDLDARYESELKQLFSVFYPMKIIIFKDVVISAKKVKILKLIDLVSQYSKDMEDVFNSLCAEESTKHTLIKEGITSLDEFHNRIKLRPLNETKFMKTCDAVWEIKPKSSEVENKDEIIKRCVEITAGFLCGFRIDLLHEIITKEMKIKIEAFDFRVMLLKSGKFEHQKGLMIKQAGCDFVSAADAVLSVLTDTPKEPSQISKELKAKGRISTEQAIRTYMTTLNRRGLLRVTDEIRDDVTYKENSGFKRNKHYCLYSLNK